LGLGRRHVRTVAVDITGLRMCLNETAVLDVYFSSSFDVCCWHLLGLLHSSP